MAGSSVALALAEDVLRAHVDPGAHVRDMPPHMAEILRDDVLVYVLPRMCPDGAERILDSARYVRSNARDDRVGYTAPYWRRADVDGDGLALLMRKVDPAGDFVASHEHPGLLLPRRIEDHGPFFSVYPEGFVENWDGFTVPSATLMSDNAVDMNRNFPHGWAAEPQQLGAGRYATSEPESRAVTDFASRHPNIFAWLSLHTFGGVYIRPCGDKPDKSMDQSDLALFHQESRSGASDTPGTQW